LMVGVVASSVSVVRSVDFLVFNKDIEHYNDFVNYSVIRELDGRSISPHFVHETRKHGCCGVANLLDWELVVYLLANVGSATHKFIPDICCKNEQPGCGDRISGEVNAKLNQPDEVLPVDFNSWDPQFKMQVMGNINLVNDTQDMGNLFGGQICNRDNTGKYSAKEKYYAKEILFYREENFVPGGNTPCNPATTTVSCTTTRYITVKTGKEFCYWISGQKTEFDYERLLRLHKKDGRLFTEGCLVYMEQYTTTICIFALVYNIGLFISFLALMAFFHIYYWEIKTLEMESYLQPRWYVQLENETKPIHGFGDVSHIPKEKTLKTQKPNSQFRL